jgi:hypothetical protein
MADTVALRWAQPADVDTIDELGTGMYFTFNLKDSQMSTSMQQ